MLERGLRWSPEDLRLLDLLARLLATSPDEMVRNGTEGVRLTQRALALAKKEHAILLDSLAAAFAESGDYENAIQAQGRAIERARHEHHEHVIRQYRARQRLYEQGFPLREGEVVLPR